MGEKERRRDQQTRKKWKDERKTKSDRRIRTERGKKRKGKKGKNGYKREWRKFGERRKKYEEKIPYEVWEANERWKGLVNDKKGYRIKGNQKGRKDWVKKRVDENERELRTYEKGRQTYEKERRSMDDSMEIEEGAKENQNQEVRREKKENEEWGFWKRYEKGDATRVSEWKKGVLQKKNLGKGRNESWDRSTYLDEEKSERKERRRLKQKRRYVRIKEKRGRKQYDGNQVNRSSVDGKKEGKIWKINPRRKRGYEERQNGEKRKRVKNRESGNQRRRWSENQRIKRRIWTEFGKERDGEITRRRKRGKVVHGYEETEKDWGKLVKREEKKKERETRRSGTIGQKGGYGGSRMEKRRSTLEKKIDWRKTRVKIWSPHGKRRRRYGRRKEKEGRKG